MLRHRITEPLKLGALIIACIGLRARAAPPSEGGHSTIKLVGVSESTSTEQSDTGVNDRIAQRLNGPTDPFPNTVPPQTPDQQPMDEGQPGMIPNGGCPSSLDEYSTDGAGEEPPPQTETESFFSRLKWLGLRHYSADGRNAGMGIPLVGTSWLNRPYYFGVDLGTVWEMDRVQSDVSRDTDMYGGIYGGWDWDYYWGTELSIQRATPELINEHVPNAPRGDRMMIYTASMMYYPWGDSYFRPYWRVGIGEMNIDYPMDNGLRRDESLWTFPFGIGIKYPVRRWLAARAELTDELGLGNSGVATQHDLTLTLALEWRFGAHPRSYWPWNPSRHIW